MSKRPILDLLMAREKQRIADEAQKRSEWEQQQKNIKQLNLAAQLSKQVGLTLMEELQAEIKQHEMYPYDAWAHVVLSPSAHLEIGETREPDEDGYRQWYVALRGNAFINSVDYITFAEGENDALRSAIARAALRAQEHEAAQAHIDDGMFE